MKRKKEIELPVAIKIIREEDKIVEIPILTAKRGTLSIFPSKNRLLASLVCSQRETTHVLPSKGEPREGRGGKGGLKVEEVSLVEEKGKGREGKGREGKGREGKGREGRGGEGRGEGKGREGKGREGREGKKRQEPGSQKPM